MELAEPEYNAPINLEKHIESAISRAHQRRLKAGDVDATLITDNATKIFEGVKDGWGKEIGKIEYASLEHRTLLQLRYSSYVTAVFKNHENILQATALLFDSEGKVKPYTQFRNDALKVMDAYNKAYLEAEYNTAVQTATHAAQWHRYASRGGSLTLRTQRDGRVRNEHRFYDGATYPVGHDFWNTWYPPNGWRCRCFVVWNREEKTVEPDGLPTVVPAFAHNAGKQGTLFSDSLPYFQIEAKYAEKAKDLFGYKPPIDPERVKANSELYHRLIKDKEHSLVMADNLSGGVAFAHKEHDRKDYPANKAAAKKLASYGHGVVIQKHVNADGVKNPELQVDGEMSDLKTSESPTSTSIANAFKSASKQGIGVVVIDVSADGETLIDGLNRGFRNRAGIKKVLLIQGKEVTEITREQFINGQIGEIIKKSRT